MSYRLMGSTLLLTILGVFGCGTAVNLVRPGPAGGKISFGGVQHDLAHLHQSTTEPTHESASWDNLVMLGRKLFFAVDLPFSFVGDVIAWPYTTSYTFINQPIPLPGIVTVDAESQLLDAPQ